MTVGRRGVGRRWRFGAAAVCLAIVGVACDNDVPADQEVLKLDDRGVGRCMSVPATVDETITSLPERIECGMAHTHEIYAVIDTGKLDPPPFDVYPGFDALEQYAQRECLDHFEPYVGISVFDSALFYSWIVPTLESWQDETVMDREILCVAGRFDGAPIEGSIKDAQI